MSALGFTLIKEDQPKKASKGAGTRGEPCLLDILLKESKVVAALTKIRSNKSLKWGY